MVTLGEAKRKKGGQFFVRSNSNWFLVDFFSTIFFQDILEAYGQ
jgi:hypothetical protein